jgi:hypothetical protein
MSDAAARSTERTATEALSGSGEATSAAPRYSIACIARPDSDAAGATLRDDATSTVLLVRAAVRDAVGVRFGGRGYRLAGN